MTQLTLDTDVEQALLSLMTACKPYHDKYFVYAVVTDKMKMDKLTKYIRKRSHEKGDLWKSILFFLNDFTAITAIPPTPAFAVDNGLGIGTLLDDFLTDETAVREAMEHVISASYAANEQRVVFFLKDFIRDQIHAELKIARMKVLWEELGHDVHHFQEEM